ncbi:MAG: hypothetical protein RMY62_014920 [Nostoc sp. ZfuVER08]|jgi:hypothetical protein|uniref:ATPase involved in DNA repair n=1 Tax=Nostoc punctiforme FACHB-252 TaxID=1357509 RepID=A0ABR8HAU1_NOSPU|nr:hypothetical protein [Nostoc punctiforme]MBD2612295.1 hypothetical protein [Nostoc punctiforme FACHB-252]MBL1201805.1 hypothetical protein [Nostoc sp. GBBB01]MDZ8010816.1 hypothetical protein [Nostoc sp. ZfuVER08]
MARAKRNSRVLDKAQLRLASIKSINSTLDVGEGLAVEVYTEKIEQLRKYLEEYNSSLSTIDVLLTKIVENEKDLADYSDKFLHGIAYKFGNNSHEYQMAGGVRKSDVYDRLRQRKRVVRESTVSPTT